MAQGQAAASVAMSAAAQLRELTDMTDSSSDREDVTRGMLEAHACCFPALSSNAVFQACSHAGLGLHPFEDAQHIVEQQQLRGAPAETADFDVAHLGLTGNLNAEQVCQFSCIRACYTLSSSHLVRCMHDAHAIRVSESAERL